MQIEILNPDGIPEVEREAHVKIEPALPKHWQGYAGLEMLDRRSSPAELDLIIVNDFQVLLVELKRIHGKLTSDGNYWYRNGERLYKNPVKVVNEKAKKLKSRIESKLAHKLNYFPFVNYCVVLYGSATKDSLTDDEKDFVIKLDDFLTIGSQGRYDKFLPLRPHEKNLSPDQQPTSQLKLWNSFFNKNKQDFVGKEFSAQNYVIQGAALWQHQDIYQEFFSQRRDDKNYKALLRRWNFHAQTIASHARTADERALIAHRESKVLGYIDNCDESLEDLHLRPLYIQDDLVADFIELYQWPKNRDRIEVFVRKFNEKLSKAERLDLIQVFVSQVARLHRIKVAHRDLGQHSVWLSLPSRVTFSNFVTASYPDPDRHTMLNLRPILQAGQANMPEDFYSDEDGTQYTRDVYLAGACAYLIAYGEWPDKDSDNLYIWKEQEADPYNCRLNDWFAKCLHLEASQRFQNMDEALDALNIILDRFRLGKIDVSTINEAFLSDTNVWTKYQCQTYSAKGTCLLLRTTDGSLAIKLWNGVSANSNGAPNHKLSVFLQRIQSIASAAIPCFPRIDEFGLNASLMNLFITYEWVSGVTLDEFELESVNNDSILSLMCNLLIGVRIIHQNHFFHGDIHPKNIVISITEPEQPKFIDIFEFIENDETPYNRNYLPDNFEHLGLEARDRYAVTKIVKELSDRIGNNEVARYADNLLRQIEIGDGDIDRFVGDFESIVNPPAPVILPTFEISLERVSTEVEELLSDEGRYFIQLKTGGEENNADFFLRIFLSGVRHQIDLHVEPESRKIIRAWFKDVPHSQFIKSKREANFEIEGKIRVVRGPVNDATVLIDHLLQHQFSRDFISENRPDLAKNYRQVLGLAKGKKFDIRQLWRVLVETEQESLPRVSVQKEPEFLPNGDIILEFSADGQSPDFDLRSDKVILKKSICGRLQLIGRVIELGRNVMRLAKGTNINLLRAGDELVLESIRSASSLAKRQKAVESILAGRSLISNLPDYFDANNNITPISLSSCPIDEELDLYNEFDANGEILFSLNMQQRNAFKALVANGPISLLQGPPGTGKTAFISSFIHYVINNGASRILLVSQSHEAVNNAAEKVRRIFESRKQCIAVVRLGEEAHASEALKDVHEFSLQEHYREKFRAEFKVRLKSSSSQIGLPDEFIETAIEFEKSFGLNVQSLSRAIESKEAPDNLQERMHRLERDLASFFDIKLSKQSEEAWNISEAKDFFYKNLARATGVSSPKLVGKFRELANLALEWLTVMSSGSANFQNFLAKTRTLVCGTCVGIGRTPYGITENTYDWVVIDEAARASASELAIAMIVGRRLLLVGDHQQLGALYDEDHIKAAKRILGSLTEKEITKSDFERAFVSTYGNQVGQTLTTQYRMVPTIGSMVSECFYNKIRLQNGREGPVAWVSALPKSLGTTVTWIDTSDKGRDAFENNIGGDESSRSRHNVYEIRLIRSLVHEITFSESFVEQFGSEASSDSPIGVICMYKEQKHEMIRYFNSAAWSQDLIEKRRVKIDTVDSYQGKENSIVIVSLVRNNSHFGIGYLSESEPSAFQRSNVAISRAKERLYLVGSTRMFEGKNENSPIGQVLNYIKRNEGVDLNFLASTSMKGH